MEAQELSKAPSVNVEPIKRQAVRDARPVVSSPDAGLQLMRAFAQIRRPALREEVLKLAASYAALDS